MTLTPLHTTLQQRRRVHLERASVSAVSSRCLKLSKSRCTKPAFYSEPRNSSSDRTRKIFFFNRRRARRSANVEPGAEGPRGPARDGPRATSRRPTRPGAIRARRGRAANPREPTTYRHRGLISPRRFARRCSARGARPSTGSAAARRARRASGRARRPRGPSPAGRPTGRRS